MSYFRGVIKALILLLAIVVVTAMFLPASTTVTRSSIIQASPQRVFTLINGFEHFKLFSPWHYLDSQSQYRYSGPVTGIGAQMQWHSDNHKLGSGSSQIIAVEQNRRVTMRLNFDRRGSATAWFELQPVGLDTQVIWGLQSDAGFDLATRYFNLLLDYFVGKDYEQGLRQLKILAEATPDVDTQAVTQQYDVRLFDQPDAERLLITTQSDQTIEAFSKAVTQAYAQLKVATLASGLNIDGAPFMVEQYSQGDHYVLTAGIFVSGEMEGKLPVGIKLEHVAATQLACSAHSNQATNKAETYQRVMHWIIDNDYLVSGPSREQHPQGVLATMTQPMYRWICFPVEAANNGG